MKSRLCLLLSCGLVLGAAPLLLVQGCKTGASTQGAPKSETIVEILPAEDPIALPLTSAEKAADYPGLHNLVAYTPELISGGVPEGDEGLATLQAMGIRTIISVDGEMPDVAGAKARGMRYVHLPIGYNGISHKRTLEIARAIKELPGPIYLHCHHGKHRSASAAGAAAVTLGEITNEDAIARMKVSGTSPNYKGLYECVNEATIVKVEELETADNAFPEESRPSGMTQSMVEMNVAITNLTEIEKAGWKTPEDHPDLVPAAEAGRLADVLRVAHQDEAIFKAWPAEFKAAFLKDSKLVEELEEGIVAGEEPALLSERFKAVNKSCKDCHTTFRDTKQVD
jgi:protein tyrosine phosphatase (PTP) superfamily phosphohydrolase (DUF442 family)